MALKSNNPLWQQLHLLARLIGVTGLVAAVCGWFIWSALALEELGLIVLCSSAVAVALALIFEVRGVAQGIASHRGLFGFNVLLQVGLALAIVVAANLYSFEHFRRYDWTRGQIFTLNDTVRKQLQGLRGETDIIVVQNYVSFGQDADNKQDKYDFAAQRKIVEKVKDLVESFQDLGPRFRVRVLDIQDENNDKKLDEIRAQATPELVEAIRKAPENSVFFYSKEKNRFQRLSFSDIYQLDKEASIERKNLVLNFQGIEPFAGKILNIEEKSPRIASAVIHPFLTMRDDSQPNYTMNGAKKILEAYGFQTTDITLRRITDGEPTVLTYDESQYEDIEDDLAFLADEIKEMQKEFEEITELHTAWSEAPLAEVNKRFAFVRLPDGRMFPAERSSIEKNRKSLGQARIVGIEEEERRLIASRYKALSERLKHALDADREEQTQLLEKKGKLQVDSLAEKRRFSDLEAKAKAMLANVDLLIVPRLTAVSIPQGEVYSNRIHRLEKGQFAAVKAFIKEGKPVLFLLGPSNEQRTRLDFGEEGPDALEPMLGELGFYLPKQTILFDAEKREFNERKFSQGDFSKSKHSADLPAVRFDESISTYTWKKSPAGFLPHPIRSSMKMTNRTLMAASGDAETGKDKKAAKHAEGSAIRIRHPRPVYFMHTSLEPEAVRDIVGSLALPGLPGAVQAAAIWQKSAQQKPDESGVFLVTGKECWNEENPFIVDNKVPRFVPTDDDSPKKGTADEERHGPFPIGVAVETQIPASWFDKAPANTPKVRVAVIGSGGLFIGPKLSPMKEKLFLDTVNWLLGRDDLLARDAGTWEYPRVSLSPLELKSWYALCYGLPVLFIYLGMTVWLVRRMR